MKHNNQYNHLPKIKLFNHSNLSTTLLLCETHYSCSICSSPTLFTNQLTATPPAHVCMIVCLYLCQLLIVFVSTFNCICQPDCIESFSIFNFSFMKKFHDFFLTRAISKLCFVHGFMNNIIHNSSCMINIDHWMKDCWSCKINIDHCHERLLIIYHNCWSLVWKTVDHVR